MIYRIEQSKKILLLTKWLYYIYQYPCPHILEGSNYFHLQVIQSQPFLITASRVASSIHQTVLLKYILFLFLYINIFMYSQGRIATPK